MEPALLQFSVLGLLLTPLLMFDNVNDSLMIDFFDAAVLFIDDGLFGFADSSMLLTLLRRLLPWMSMTPLILMIPFLLLPPLMSPICLMMIVSLVLLTL